MSMMMPPGPGPAPAPPAEEPGPSQTSSGDGSNLDFLRMMIEAGSKYNEEEDDDINIAKVSKILAALQQILAEEQRTSESALGVTPAAKFLAKNSGGGS